MPSSEIPCLHLDRVEVQVGDIDVPRPQALGRQVAGVRCRRAVMEFVASSMRQRKRLVPLPDAGELARHVGQSLRHEVDDLALALDAATHGNHPG